MNLSIRKFGFTKDSGDIIELCYDDGSCRVVNKVTDLNGLVSQDLIDSLRDIAYELEVQNEYIKIQKL